MRETYIVYDPDVLNGNGREEAEILDVIYKKTILVDVNKIKNCQRFLMGMEDSDQVILCGDDRILQRFALGIQGMAVEKELLFYSVGSRNDLVRDLGEAVGSVPDYAVNHCLANLPVLRIRGKEKCIVNGVGYGMILMGRAKPDLYGDHIKEAPKTSFLEAIFGFLLRQEPVNVEIEIDGKVKQYEKAWMVCTMKGRYLEGVMAAPGQERFDKNRTVSVVVIHRISKRKALNIFFRLSRKGKIKDRDGMEVLKGSQVRVMFEHPAYVQVDGEAFFDVHDYMVST